MLIEKYRPKKLCDIMGQDIIIRKLQGYVDSGSIPHLLFAGKQGTGKTTAALCIVNETNAQYEEINSSDERGIDVVRDKIKKFCVSKPISKKNRKILILDEVDGTTKDFQGALRRIMETYHNNVTFILACNNLYKLIDPIISRCQFFRFKPLKKEMIKDRLKQICKSEKFKCEDVKLDTINFCSEGDLRKAIGLLEVSHDISIDEILEMNDYVNGDLLTKFVIEPITEGRFRDAWIQLLSVIDEGYSPRNILISMLRIIDDMDIKEVTKAAMIDVIGETDWRLSEGGGNNMANCVIQMRAMIAQFLLILKEE